jgi:hypothetical protein
MTAQYKFNLSRNVEEEFSFNVPDSFATAPNSVARITNSIIITATPVLGVAPTATMPITSIAISATGTTATAGPSNATYTMLTTVCCISVGNSNSFTSLNNASIRVGNNYGVPWKVWIPFTATDLTQGQTIVSATLRFYDDVGDGVRCDDQSYKIGCDLRADATAPTSYDDLNARTSTVNTLFTTTGCWNPGDLFSVDVTAPLQQLLNVASWGSVEKTVAILFQDNNSYNSGRWIDGTLAAYGLPSLYVTW